MASTNTNSATTTITPNVLTSLGFETLSHGISLYQPRERSPAGDPPQSPTLIIVCSWAFAQPKHIGKYLQAYKEIYSGASILLVQNIISNTVWRPDSWQMSYFQPAALAIQAHLSSTRHPKVLLHAFSNGGSHAAVQLSQTCRETCGGMRLPIDALLLDSCPGQLRAAITVLALVQGIPSKNYFVRGMGTILVYLSIGVTGLFDILNVCEPAVRKLWRRLNDPTDVFLLKAPSDQASSRLVPRTYLYSQSDTMIMWQDVVEHAGFAKEQLVAHLEKIDAKQATDVVRLEEFSGTAHVNHVKNHRTQYWDVVKETWTKAERLMVLPS